MVSEGAQASRSWLHLVAKGSSLGIGSGVAPVDTAGPVK